MSGVEERMPRPIPGAGWAELVRLWEGFIFAG